MARKGKRSKRSKRNGNVVSVHRAPSMQGMQQVDTWDLINVVPILLNEPGESVDVSTPFLLQAGFNANGWFYEVKQGGLPTSFRQEPWGFDTFQFDEIQRLWSTYRVNQVECMITPCQFGAGYSTPIVSAVDPAGEFGPINRATPQEDLLCLSRLRSVAITENPLQRCKRTFNYGNWLMQTCPTAWQLTVNGPKDTTNLRYPRGLYPEGPNEGATPQVRFLTQAVPSFGNTILAFMHIRCNVSVRGRRGVPLDGFEPITTTTAQAPVETSNKPAIKQLASMCSTRR